MKKLIATMLGIGASVIFAGPVSGQEIDIRKGAIGGAQGVTANLQIDQIVVGIIYLLVVGAALLFFFWLILGGIKWITSGGDKTKIEEARGQITSALVGLVIVFSAWAIAQLIDTLFGVNFFNLKIPSLNDIGGPSAPFGSAPTRSDCDPLFGGDPANCPF